MKHFSLYGCKGKWKMTWFFQKVDTLKEFRQFAFSYLLQKAFKVVNFGSFYYYFFFRNSWINNCFSMAQLLLFGRLETLSVGNTASQSIIEWYWWWSNFMWILKFNFLSPYFLLTLVEKWIPFAVPVLENEVKMLKWWLYQSRIGFSKSKNW